MIHEERVACHVVELVVGNAIDSSVADHACDANFVFAVEAGGAVIFLSGASGRNSGRAVCYVRSRRVAAGAVGWGVGADRAFAVRFVVVVHAELVVGTVIDSVRRRHGDIADGDAHRVGAYPQVEQLSDGRRRNPRA